MEVSLSAPTVVFVLCGCFNKCILNTYICSILNVKFGFPKVFIPILDLAELRGFPFFFKTLQRKCFVVLFCLNFCISLKKFTDFFLNRNYPKTSFQ